MGSKSEKGIRSSNQKHLANLGAPIIFSPTAVNLQKGELFPTW